jgi:hypothetical protein
MRIHERGGKQEQADRPLDEVEWELIKADLALLKYEARRDMARWWASQRRWHEDNHAIWAERYRNLAWRRSFYGSDPAR